MLAQTSHKHAPALVPKTTKACVVHEFGTPSVIGLETIDMPVPGPGEVLVRVKAVGVGPWDGWIRAGKSVLPQPLPLTLGSDLSGVVEAVGADVSALTQGDEVFGVTNTRFTGAYAEYALATAGMMTRKPPRLSHVDAASVPVVAVTAWQALFEQADLKSGERVLIHGAAGSVGAYAVQLARRAGLHVIATASGRDIPFVRSLGAAEALDYKAVRFEDVVGPVDAVIDLVGGETQTRSFSVLKKGGTLVSAVSTPDKALAARHGVRAMFFLVAVTTERLAQIAELLGKGALGTDVGAVLPLASARVAHEMLEGFRPRPRGKIVLRVSD